MRPGPVHWFGALRRRRHAILCALLPALALSAASGPACAAMLRVPASDTAAGSHSTHDAHAHRHAVPADEPVAPVTPCPHCPLESGAANTHHASCVTAAAQDDGGAAPTNVSSVPTPAVFLTSWLLPAARASPPLSAIAHDTPLASPVPLNLRHCVLLI